MTDSFPDLAQSSPPIITLLSDFGLEDVYVSVMKGVITCIYPAARLIDLTHQIPPQNIEIGSFQLGNAYPHFPPGTIHVAVVDPGVGSPRRAVAIQTPSGILIGPDNGLFSHVLMQESAIAAVELTHRQYWYTEEPSHTFHGRDIFAPVAAHIASGISFPELGPPLELNSLNRLVSCTTWHPNHSGGTGIIQAIDHFGNLITNIPASQTQHRSWSLHIGQSFIPSTTSYATSEVDPKVKALAGSHGWLEIALPNGNAQHFLSSNVGDLVTLKLHH
ncbi:SAM-dependent chlorinase/fluorinase [Acaryochloris sp. IP29b_bin.148]|uniref:SAM hydrolase/SAM-dependent halogenase family protein n=1 Tax=Acaryochloris sp. IP29b_bin.148 TaxID=2969218 RepID=UPI00261C9352|nr:SAM-dependent chlorinase/fluorinase [Acaryochloris sp. IP29b_bin.148]